MPSDRQERERESNLSECQFRRIAYPSLLEDNVLSSFASEPRYTNDVEQSHNYGKALEIFECRMTHCVLPEIDRRDCDRRS